MNAALAHDKHKARIKVARTCCAILAMVRELWQQLQVREQDGGRSVAASAITFKIGSNSDDDNNSNTNILTRNANANANANADATATAIAMSAQWSV